MWNTIRTSTIISNYEKNVSIQKQKEKEEKKKDKDRNYTWRLYVSSPWELISNQVNMEAQYK